ncbi:MAG: aminomethyl transferase family protein [Chloroflexi bacterium]|nr:aminomethyl transferase family protein [Chloroflexota bacterium]MCH8102083.1 aminomethyl transferase family protein [Chloroflexota bacterium]
MINRSLDEIHKRAETLVKVDGVNIPLRFGEIADEYAAFRVGAALVDRSHLGRLEQSGADAIDLLHRLSTADIESLAEGEARRTILASERGRILDVFTVVRRPGQPLLLLTSGVFKTLFLEKIDFYTITEDSRLEDVSARTAQLALAGPRSITVISQLAGASVASLPAGRHADVVIAGVRVLVIAAFEGTNTSFDLIMDADSAADVWNAAASSGAIPAGRAAAEAYRVEIGVPTAGREITEKVNPLEANLLKLIDFDKGCYIGQEVIARLDTYDKVQRKLVGLQAAGGLFEGDLLYVDGREIGWTATVAESPAFDGLIALGYVRNEHAREGRQVVTEAGLEVRVCDLPMDPA